MKISRLGTLCLASAWFAACATAQDGGTPGTSNGGSSGSTAGGTFGSGGAPGAGGSNAFGGSGALPFGGATGAAGNGSSSSGAAGLTSGGASGSGTGGAAGTASGSGGGGGSAPVFETGVCAVNPTMSLSYKQSDVGVQITAQFQFSNTSDTPIPVAALKIRYFFSNEETTGWSSHLYSAQIDGGVGYRNIATGASLTIVRLPTELVGADSYIEIGFTDAATIEKGATGAVSWQLQPLVYTPPPAQVQANDFSFNAADIAFTVWDHVAIYQGNTLVWGCTPKPLGGGSAGAGGDTGTGGDTSVAGVPGTAGAP